MKWSLLQRIEIYLKRTRTPPTRFGLEAVRDPRLVFQIRRGRAVRPPLEAKIAAYLDRAEREAGLSPRRRAR